MGPEATAEIFRRIVSLTFAGCDQEHMKICILNKPQIPDRTEHLINNGPSPLPHIIEGINELRKLNTKFFIIPCNTSHIFADHFDEEKDIVFIDMVKTTRNYLQKQFGEEKICILGTTGTVSANVYGVGNGADRSCMFYPDPPLQRKIMDIILSVKANNRSILYNGELIIEIMKKILEDNGDCTFVVACTELSVILADMQIAGINFVDAMELLAINAILKCGYKVNEQKTEICISAVT